MKGHAIVIGSGVAGLAAAATLGKGGFAVTVLEKNDTVGGRARAWCEQGFTFDMGPSFYWMPDVFERFFDRFDLKVADLYSLVRLDPSYSIIFGSDRWEIPAGQQAVAALFERHERGSGAALERFLAEARTKYDLGMRDLVYRPSLSWLEYLDPRIWSGLLRTTVISSLRKHIRHHFTDERIRQVMEFPALFLGSTAQGTPALYSLMNYADVVLGTWYPLGGMGRVVEAMAQVAEQQGARIRCASSVRAIRVRDGRAVGVESVDGPMDADVVVATADYHHVEQDLLPEEHRSYSTAFWKKQRMAPSTLLFYLGVDRRIPQLQHHTLFFDAPMDEHGADIYVHRRWPRDPLFYVSCTSRTDPAAAPMGMENLVVLIPIPSGAEDTPELRERYFHLVMERLLSRIGIDLRKHLRVRRDYCVNDLRADHNAFRGNAYGLASTLGQTGPWRPRIKSRKVKGLYFAGQLSVPGPGVPPALISGQVAADLVLNEHRQRA